MMNNETTDPQSFLPLTTPTFNILLTLANGELHGYGIIQEVKKRTEGRVKIGPGTLYGRLSRMLEADLVQESDERPDPEIDDERRRYYHLTDLGRKVAVAETRRLTSLLQEANRLLSDL
jgi:DNA-binding PadR family transcriptional regulator